MAQDQYTGESYELNTDLAPLAAAQNAAAQQLQDINIPVSSFVGSLNNQTGNVDIEGGTYNGVTYTFTGGGGAVTLTVSGIGAMALKAVAAAVADIATADATDLPTVIALANATKAKVNELLGSLRAAGHIAP